MTTLTNFKAIELFGGGGGVGDLATVLGVGNTTGGTDVIFSYSGVGTDLDRIGSEDNAGGAGYAFNLDGSDALAGVSAGGDINLNPGSGWGGGPDGVVNIVGDLVVTGTVILTNLISGAGSPESAVVANIGTFYSRTDGSDGNSQYFKQWGVGNTGWVPAGPLVVENTSSSGAAAFVTGRAVFDAAVVTTVDNLSVYWNGVLQREGLTEDYTVAFNVPPGAATITFLATPPSGDLVTIKYLPE